MSNASDRVTFLDECRRGVDRWVGGSVDRQSASSRSVEVDAIYPYCKLIKGMGPFVERCSRRYSLLGLQFGIVWA